MADNEVVDDVVGDEGAGDAGDGDDGSGEGADGTGADPKALGAAPTTRKITVNGKVREVTLEELERAYSKGLGADEKFQSAAKLAKAAQELETKFKADPMKALTEIFGFDKAKEMMEQRLYEHYKEQSLSPEQKAAAEKERALQEREKKAAEKERQLAEAEFKRKAEAFALKFDSDASKAMDAAGLERNWGTIARFTELAKLAIDNDMDLDLADIAAKVKEESSSVPKNYIKAMSVDALAELLSDRMDELAKFRVGKLKATGQKPTATAKATPKPAKKRSEPLNEMSWDEKMEAIKQQFGE